MMEFIIGLATGVVLCLSVKVPAKKITRTNTADTQVDVLSTKANKALSDLKHTKNQIQQVSHKAETAHTDLTVQISKLAS